MAKKQKSPEEERRRTYSKVRHSLRLVKRWIQVSFTTTNSSVTWSLLLEYSTFSPVEQENMHFTFWDIERMRLQLALR